MGAQFTVSRRKSLPAGPDAAPFGNDVRIDIQLHVPDGATPDDFSLTLTAALCELAEDFGAWYAANNQTEKVA